MEQARVTRLLRAQPEDRASYIIARKDNAGPFGLVEQVSARMRLSEAACTVASLEPAWLGWRFVIVEERALR